MSVDLSIYGDWYAPGWAELNSRGQYSEKTVEVLADAAEQLGLDKCATCLSIGPGAGYVDVPLIRDAMPSLKYYCGIEPRPDAIQEMRQWFDRDIGPHIKGEFVQDNIENWGGPSGGTQFDVILVIQVLYHIPDRQEFFKRCMDWLKLGGLMVIGHMGKGLGYVTGQALGVTEHLFSAEDIADDLRNIGITDWSVKKTSLNVDLNNRDKTLLDFVLLRNGTDDELERLDKIIDGCLPTGVSKEDVYLYFVHKA